jgi:hypothetical protein
MAMVMGTPAFRQLVQQVGGRQEIVGRWPYHSGQAGENFSAPYPVPAGGGCPQATVPGPGGGCVPVTYGGPGVAYGSTPYVADIPFTELREQTLGFFQSGLASATVTAVISRPQIVFRGERLVIPSTLSANFSINDIRIGNRSQLGNSNVLPAQMFIETAVGVRLSLDTAQIAQDIAIEVNNISNTNVTFQAALIGTIAQ